MNSKQIMSINIPNDWSFVPIYDLRNKNDRYSFTGGPFGSDLKSEHYTDSGVRVIQLQNIGEGKFYNDNKVFTSEEKANQLKTCLIYPDEIILAKMFPAGRSCKIPRAEEKFLMCSDGIRLSVDRSKYNNDFVFQALNTSYFLKAVQSQSTGTTRSRIGLNDLKIIPIAIPNSIIEQQKIADILTTVDDKLENVESQIAEYTNLKTGLMQQLLTKGIGHTKFVDSELGMIPEGWEVVKLSDVCEIKRGLASQHLSYVQTGNEGVRLIRINDINSYDPKYIQETNETKKLILRQNDILIAGTGATAGISCLVKENWAGLPFSYNIPRIRIKNGLIPSFLYYCLNTGRTKKQQDKFFTGNAQHFLDTRAIGNLKILSPPIDEQQRIANALTAVDDKIESLQQKKEEFTNLKKGLMEQLLTGRIRVKV